MSTQEVREIKFTELDQYVGEPLWDSGKNRWRVLMGYRRYDHNREVIFTGSKGMEDWNSVSLTTEKLTQQPIMELE